MKTEWERLEMFQRIRSEIRGSSDTLIVGIDVGKDKHLALFATPTGGPLQEPLVFGNHRVGFEHLLARADQLEVEWEMSQVVFGLKPNRVYHKPLLEYLIRQEELAVLVSTGAVEGNAERVDGWGAPKPHVDRAAAVAEQVGQGQFRFAPAPDPDLDALRQLVGARARLKQQEHALGRRLRHHLMAPYFPELAWGYGAGHGADDEVVLKMARTCFDPDAIAGMGFDAFWNQVAEPSWGRREEARLFAVWHAAQDSIGCAMSEAVAWQARSLVDELRSVRWQLAELDDLTRQLALRRPGYESLLTIPGVGPSGAARILALLGDPHRFRHRRQVLRLAGLDLCTRRGANRRDGAGPTISRQGSAALRCALLQAARVAVRCHPTVRTVWTTWGRGRENERGIRRKMEVKLAAKLLVLAWTLLRHGGRFDPQRFARQMSSAPGGPTRGVPTALCREGLTR